MPIEIFPPRGIRILTLEEIVRGEDETKVVRTGKDLIGLVPEGNRVTLRINGLIYVADDYRGRTGHTEGARITGVGVLLELEPGERSKIVNRITFSWRPKSEEKNFWWWNSRRRK